MPIFPRQQGFASQNLAKILTGRIPISPLPVVVQNDQRTLWFLALLIQCPLLQCEIKKLPLWLVPCSLFIYQNGHVPLEL